MPASVFPTTTPPSVSVGTAAWSTRVGALTTGTLLRTGLRCASLLKPLYGWVATAADPQDIAASIRQSDNAATNRVVEAAGGVRGLRNMLAEATGIDVGEAQTWGRFEVTPEQVATMYARMQDSPNSGAILDLMRDTDQTHRFKADQTWAHATHQDLTTVAIKTGWDLSDDEPFARTHAVVLGDYCSAVTMTAVPVTDHQRQEWESRLSANGPRGVLDLHEQWSGHALRNTLTSTAAALGL